MAEPKSIAQVLNDAAEIVERGWCQGWFAKDASGLEIRDDDEAREESLVALHPDAVSVCCVGAIVKAAGEAAAASETDNSRRDLALIFVSDVVAMHVPSWNDEAGRTQAEVVAALREAAKRAESDSHVG